MIVQKIQDKEGNTISVHFNINESPVLVAENTENNLQFIVYSFESVEDIDFLINQLTELKNEING